MTEESEGFTFDVRDWAAMTVVGGAGLFTLLTGNIWGLIPLVGAVLGTSIALSVID
jgi:hypothetical protein